MFLAICCLILFCPGVLQASLEKRSIHKRDAGYCSGNLCYKMDTGTVLPIGSSLWSANGKYELQMQPDKNLVLYCYAGNAIWHADTYGNDVDGGLKFTEDGSLEITEVGTGNSLWKNGVSGGEMLFLQNDGNLVMYDIQERNIWETGTGLAYCEKGYCIGDRCVKPSLRDGYALLKLGEELISKNGKYDLRMQTDGNLVVYCNGNALWHSETYGRSVTGGLRFQGDSNLVIYDPNPIWHSSTYDNGATTLIMQDDGNVVLYTRDGRSVWHTGTFGMC
ncbi:uncharacterized protein LOC134821259 [Bolinopsis microptera]|uniref:uncharacterized protein LOC134821259 n=1 Tax=Bolinopsis microptera TaxID=2820187 RepID=UPI00307ADBD5